MRQLVTTVKLKGRLICAAASLVVLFSSTGTIASAQEIETDKTQLSRVQQDTSPLDCFKMAWRYAKENFYEPTYNGQDWSRWEHKYDSLIRDFDDANLAISTMIASLGDKESYFLPARCFDDEKNQIIAQFCGVGIHIGLTETGKIEVRTTIPRTPAFYAGLQTGDVIVAVNHAPAPVLIVDSVHLIRGLKQTKVTLTIQRGDERRDFTITRDEIPVFCVFNSSMLDEETGYIRIETLISSKSTNDILESLSKLSSAKGIILDLRGNAGGLLDTAMDVATIFLEDGTIASVVDQNGETKSVYKVGKERICRLGNESSRLPIFRKPLVILTDSSTSGSTEILTAALKDNQRAKLVGEKTRGRGKVQGIFRLPNGAGVNLSCFRYLTPLNTDVMLGIEPDYVIALSEEDKSACRGPWYSYGRGTTTHGGRNPKDGRDIQLATAHEFMRKRLEWLKHWPK